MKLDIDVTQKVIWLRDNNPDKRFQAGTECTEATFFNEGDAVHTVYLWAHIAKNEPYQVKYDANSGGFDGQVPPEPKVFDYDLYAVQFDIVPKRDGYDFTGWAYLTASGETEVFTLAKYNQLTKELGKLKARRSEIAADQGLAEQERKAALADQDELIEAKELELQIRIERAPTFYAQWTAGSYTVTYDGNEGTLTRGESAAPLNVDVRDDRDGAAEMLLSDGAKEIITEEEEGGGTYTYTSVHYTIPDVRANKAIRATIVKKVFVTMNANGGKFQSDSTTVKELVGNLNDIISCEEPVRDGYRFLGWSEAQGASSGNQSPAYTADKTYYAVWSIDVFDYVTFEQGEHATVDTKTVALHRDGESIGKIIGFASKEPIATHNDYSTSKSHHELKWWATTADHTGMRVTAESDFKKLPFSATGSAAVDKLGTITTTETVRMTYVQYHEGGTSTVVTVTGETTLQPCGNGTGATDNQLTSDGAAVIEEKAAPASGAPAGTLGETTRKTIVVPGSGASSNTVLDKSYQPAPGNVTVTPDDPTDGAVDPTTGAVSVKGKTTVTTYQSDGAGGSETDKTAVITPPPLTRMRTTSSSPQAKQARRSSSPARRRRSRTATRHSRTKTARSSAIRRSSPSRAMTTVRRSMLTVPSRARTP